MARVKAKENGNTIKKQGGKNTPCFYGCHSMIRCLGLIFTVVRMGIPSLSYSTVTTFAA